MKKALGIIGIVLFVAILVAGAYFAIKGSKKTEAQELPASRSAGTAYAQSHTPGPVTLGVKAGSVDNQYDVAEVGYVETMIDSGMSAGMAAAAAASNMAVHARAFLDTTFALNVTNVSGVRVHVYGQEDYNLAETDFVTNLVQQSVGGAVEAIVDDVNTTVYGRRSLLDHYTLSERGEVIADYTWMWEVEVLPGHVGKECVVPLGFTGFSYADVPNTYDMNEYYLCMTGTVTSVVPPFTVGCMMFPTNSVDYYRFPRLFFIPQTSGVFLVTMTDNGPFLSTSSKAVSVSVTKAASDEITILPRTRPPKPTTELAAGSHWEFDYSRWEWVRISDGAAATAQTAGYTPTERQLIYLKKLVAFDAYNGVEESVFGSSGDTLYFFRSNMTSTGTPKVFNDALGSAGYNLTFVSTDSTYSTGTGTHQARLVDKSEVGNYQELRVTVSNDHLYKIRLEINNLDSLPPGFAATDLRFTATVTDTGSAPDTDEN